MVEPQPPHKLLLAQPRTKTFCGFRNWAMILLMLDTGLRLSEALGLRPQPFRARSLGLTLQGIAGASSPRGVLGQDAMLNQFDDIAVGRVL